MVKKESREEVYVVLYSEPVAEYASIWREQDHAGRMFGDDDKQSGGECLELRGWEYIGEWSMRKNLEGREGQTCWG